MNMHSIGRRASAAGLLAALAACSSAGGLGNVATVGTAAPELCLSSCAICFWCRPDLLSFDSQFCFDLLQDSLGGFRGWVKAGEAAEGKP